MILAPRGNGTRTEGSPEQVYLRRQSRMVRRRAAGSWQALWAAVRGAADPRELVRRHPWMTAGAVLAGGFVLVAAARRVRPAIATEAHAAADRATRWGLVSEAARAARGVLLTAMMSRWVAAPCDEAVDAARVSRDGVPAGGDAVATEASLAP